MSGSRRSHPPTLLKLAERALREECVVPRGARILCAVSGGPDSMALLDVLAALAPKLAYELVAHGVDHGLRPEAVAELELAARHAAARGVPFERSRVSIAAGGNLQARARTARYTALDAAAERAGATFIATAHHADDRAETVLLRLLRGSGPRGLAVLPPLAGNRVRPLLRARRSDVLLHLQRHGVPFAEDPSNRDRRHLRVRVREELLPLLSELSPGVVAHLNALSDMLAPLLDRDSAVAGGIAGLGRAQRRQLERAVALSQRKSEIWLAGGAVLALDATLTPRLLSRAPGQSSRGPTRRRARERPRKNAG
ncbi:MAG TPA: tRNA lysidine(34) synthetase TilS [Polyangiaceae bacterium]|nr:tRNA lysidine(34) synthetase TilS [Polyangiaceae bacterium]